MQRGIDPGFMHLEGENLLPDAERLAGSFQVGGLPGRGFDPPKAVRRQSGRLAGAIGRPVSDPEP